MLHRLVFLFKNLANALQKHFEYDQIKTKIFGLKDEAIKPLKREKAKTINCHHSDVLWKIQRYLFLWNFHTKISPLFNRFSIFDKNVNLSKANPEAEKNSFLVFPSLNTSIFTTYPKIASTLTPFEGPRLKSHPPKFRSLTL